MTTATNAVYQTEVKGLKLANRGKVRDIYELGDALLIVATDRLSAFDVVFPTPIPGKGKVLTQMTLFWLNNIQDIVPNHLITGEIEDIMAAVREAGGDASDEVAGILDGRSMLVRKAQPFPIECVVRGYISGSMWKDYVASGGAAELYGHKLPPGLVESGKLPEPIFTPATKATTGHDENISIHQAAEIVGQKTFDRLESLSLAIYCRGRDVAAEKGIIIADTKFEFGLRDGQIILIDEVLTPDSSRFWDYTQYQPGKSQDSFDKQYVRDWLEARNWDKKPPAPELPPDVVRNTTERYLEAYRRITGRELQV
ncbi:MAG: phosphoribosylaminoimidazole-succinocarboxamide synthase [Armatimonadota bacterium]|nr:MAG: phosphoribosylaminoimidazole-succinocarboxamide synthase [Armatimonadota bacterium]